MFVHLGFGVIAHLCDKAQMGGNGVLVNGYFYSSIHFSRVVIIFFA
jgi:hypothetical protein